MTDSMTNYRSSRWRRASRILSLALLLAVVALLAGPALAQDYYFAVPTLQLQVFIEPDGTARLVYDITFRNEASGRAIDVVDIGLPTGDYQISNMTASIDGMELYDIRPSEYVKPGVEVHLDNQWISPGDTGTLHFEAVIPDLLFQDVTNRDYASFQITPTWFGSQYISGLTDVQIAIHLPEGISPETMLYQNEAFGQRALFQDRAVALWQFPATQLTGPHLVGVSFPSAGIAGVQRMTVFDLAERWFVSQTTLRLILGVLFLGIFTAIFVRLTGGTGWTLWFIGAAALVFAFIRWPLSLLAGFIPLLAALYLVERWRRTRKLPYMPPIAQVEGGGIKRGLTAPEAAALLEMPLNKVLTLIVFGLLKKGALRQTSADPFQVESTEAFRAAKGKQEERWQARRAAAQAAGVTLQGYEQRFLDAIDAKPNTPLRKIEFAQAMDWFLANVSKRMKGFDISDTQEYYQAIVRRAVEQAKAIPDIPLREVALDRDMEWILLDNSFSDVFNTPSYSYRPTWVRASSGSGGLYSGPSGGGGSSPGGGAFAPSFSNVAAGFAGWTENTMGSLAAAISPSSLPSLAGKSGFVNLSGVDKATADVFQALASSSKSGGGGGGGSCACAGCACACACAGGGR